jgi:hypothetical protein
VSGKVMRKGRVEAYWLRERNWNISAPKVGRLSALSMEGLRTREDRIWEMKVKWWEVDWFE